MIELKPTNKKYLYDGERTYHSVLLTKLEDKTKYSEVDNWIEPIAYSPQELQEEIERLIAEHYTIRQEALILMNQDTQEYHKYIDFKNDCKARAKVILKQKKYNEQIIE